MLLPNVIVRVVVHPARYSNNYIKGDNQEVVNSSMKYMKQQLL